MQSASTPKRNIKRGPVCDFSRSRDEGAARIRVVGPDLICAHTVTVQALCIMRIRMTWLYMDRAHVHGMHSVTLVYAYMHIYVHTCIHIHACVCMYTCAQMPHRLDFIMHHCICKCYNIQL